MQCVIKLFPEIMVKSRSVRLHFIKILVKNIYILLKKHNFLLVPVRYWDCIKLEIDDNDALLDIIKLLVKIPGINQILLVEEYSFNTIHDIAEKIGILNYNRLTGRCFCVRVKRRGSHSFTSQDVECYLGDYIRKNISNTYVRLINPEVTIFIEINENRFFLVVKRYQGLGGFPLGTQGSVLSLISGGFDSAVSSYMLIKRGCKVHYCFFNFGGVSHKIHVNKIAYYLWTNFSSSHKVRLFSVNFLPIVNEIAQKVDLSLMIIVLKRMMFRLASSIAVQYKIKALVTGESIGQVSSQTLTNLSIIDSVADIMILRPLVSYDKEQIIALARYIGIEKMINVIPEYCSVFSKKIAVGAIRSYVEQQEKRINFSILHEVLTQVKALDIRDIVFGSQQSSIDVVKITSKINTKEIVLDIRSQEEQDLQPLKLDNNVTIQKMPFYKLSSQFSTLDPNNLYLLYCNHGIMSTIQAEHLYAQGFRNIKIYRPDKHSRKL